MKKKLLTVAIVLAQLSANAQAWELMDTIPNFKPEEAAFMPNAYYLAGYYSSGFPTIIKSIDQGETWQNITNNLPNPVAEISGIHFRNDTDGVVCSKDGSVYYTSDGGSTWDSGVTTIQLVSGEFLSGVYFLNSLIGFVSVYNVSPNPNLWKTIDGGNTWAAVSIGVNQSINGLKGRGNTVFAYTGSNAAIKSFDGGNNWFIDYLGVGGSLLSDPNFISETTMLVGGSGGAYLIEDSLSTTVLSYDIGGTYATANAINDSENWFVAGQNLNIYFTEDEGQNYVNRPLSPDPNFIATTITNANFSDLNRPLVAGYTVYNGLKGFIYKWNPNASNVGISEINLKQAVVYPNPTNGLIQIENTESIENIEVVNVLGKTVLNFSSSKTIDISEVPNGIYTIRLTSKNEIITKSIIKN